MRILKILLAILVFPFLWILMYLYRLLWFNIIRGFFECLAKLFINPIVFIIGLLIWILCTLIDALIGLVVTFVVALSSSMEIAKGDYTKEKFKNDAIINNKIM